MFLNNQFLLIIIPFYSIPIFVFEVLNLSKDILIQFLEEHKNTKFTFKCVNIIRKKIDILKMKTDY